MEQNIITEERIMSILDKILSEETSKVKREEYNRVQFKIEELENSINDAIKELNKLKDCIPDGLKTFTNGRISNISHNLGESKKTANVLKLKIKSHKKSIYGQQVDETKKK